MVVDEAGLALPARTGILEETDQLSLLGVDTDDGPVSAVKAAAQVCDVLKLLIPVCAAIRGELFAVDAKGVVHLVQQPRDGVGGNDKALLREQVGDLAGRAAGPAEPGDGIAGRVVDEQPFDGDQELGGFFSRA
jgi:hypothetical protein